MNLRCFSAALLTAVVFFSACKKDSGSSPNTSTPGDGETPFQSIVTNDTLINSKSAYGQTGGAEIGYRIHFLKGGTITQLGANMATAGSYAVSFWRISDTALLGRANVDVTDTARFSYADVKNFDVKPDTAYIVSIHVPDGASNYHFIYTHVPFHDLFPITAGNVVADGVVDLAYLPVNTQPQYPVTEYSGDQGYVGSSCDFVFKVSQ